MFRKGNQSDHVTYGAISVAIVNHNGERYLGRTLEAVERCGAILDEVLLVDNGSTDESVALARDRMPQLQVIELGWNRGPGAARNVALRAAHHDRVLLIDNDVMPQPGCAEALAAAIDANTNAAIAMPAVRYASDPGTVQYVGASAHFLGTSEPRLADTLLASLDPRTLVVGSAITCCMLVDRTRLGDQCRFDEELFFYLEDHEFGLRLSLMGHELLAVPTAQCLHDTGTVGVSIRETGRFTSTRVRGMILNRWQVLLKLYQPATLLRFAPALATFELFQLAGVLRKGWFGDWLWAVCSVARLLPGLHRRRRSFQRHRRRPDLEVLTAGAFPFNKAMHDDGFVRFGRRILDAIANLNWRIAGGRP